jgi:tetratricopeptide (TPR) repeat protein
LYICMPLQNAPFIGRDSERHRVSLSLIRAAQGNGGTILIEGANGMGKAALLRELEKRIRDHTQLGEAEFITVRCSRSIGQVNPFQPFAEVLYALSNPATDRRSMAKKAISIMKETAPDWLEALPLIGRFAKPIVKTGSMILDTALTLDSSKQIDRSNVKILQYLNTITRLASNYRPLVIILLDAQWIDNSSCELLLRLAHIAPSHNLVVIATYRPENLDERHQLTITRQELQNENLCEIISLQGWNVDELKTYIKQRYGSELNTNLAAWLLYLCNGEPLFVTQFLSLLEQEGIIRLTMRGYMLDGDLIHESNDWKVEGALEKVLPMKSTEDLLKQRVPLLDKGDLHILQAGATQGQRFMSTVLARLLSREEVEFAVYLKELRDRSSIITLEHEEEWLRTRSDVYRFAFNLMQQVFYNQLSPFVRTQYHGNIAKILESILQEMPSAPRKVKLEIAKHYSLGGFPLKAASFCLQAAQSTFRDGALAETRKLCDMALESMSKSTKGTVESDKLYAETIQLKLLSSEILWRGAFGDQNISFEENNLVLKAEAAAIRTRDASLIARIKLLKGKVIQTSNLNRAIEVMREALEIAKEGSDLVAQFYILSQLGHLIVGMRAPDGSALTFDSGLELLYEAHRIYTNHLKSRDDLDQSELSRYLHILESRIGVGEFDRGNFDEAICWLTVSIDGLRKLNRQEDLQWPLNFIAQTYIAMGFYEEAEKLLIEAKALPLGSDVGLSPVVATNLALLGKLYLEWGRIKDAEKPLVEGWNNAQKLWTAAVISTVRNYYAELLMHPESTLYNLTLSKTMLQETIIETERTKFYRSMITARSLMGKLALMETDLKGAIEYSSSAVEQLEKMGTMPLVRTEEIYFNHYNVLRASHNYPEAERYLKLAYDIIMRKASTIKNEKYRKLFLENVVLNRMIISAKKKLMNTGEPQPLST